MNGFKEGKWIWTSEDHGENTHIEFIDSFVCNEVKKTVFRISCDSDYTLYINGRFVESNQYGGYEHFKIYDELDVTEYIRAGKNTLAIKVWYFGRESSRYSPAAAGLVFEVECGCDICASSGTSTICRKSRAYAEGMDKIVTSQLGFSFRYDATKEDDWVNGNGEGFVSAVCVDKNCDMFPRPNEKLRLSDRKTASSIETFDGGKRYIVDLGEETVGTPSLEFFSETDGNEILVTWGELLENGHVKRLIGNRDFSYEYVASKGENVFEKHGLRLGCRYLELFASEKISLTYMGVRPQYYPTKRIDVNIDNTTDRDIYDVCIRTLELCMMEHYVDCPWREQALYAFDSRNQMLCGYYAFKGGNKGYARSNLLLLGIAEQIDGLLPICSPSGIDLTIPSFGLYYYLALKEYTLHSGDTSLAAEMLDMLNALMNVYLGNRKNGLVYRFAGRKNWNFYEWTEYADGTLGRDDEPVPDMMINSLTVMALQCLEWLCGAVNREFLFAGEAEKLKANINKSFFSSEDGAYTMLAGEKQYTELCNSFAVLLDIADARTQRRICEAMTEKRFIECSLSTRCFRYDAWLKVDKERYSEAILSEIRRDYGQMLAQGATSVWETVKGASDFENAGSLCHGWSAIPVYYYHKLGIAKVNTEK